MPDWTAPKTWTSEPLVSTDMNTHIRDNLGWLKAPPSDEYTLNQGADYQTTSTTFVNIDATNLSLAITTAGGDVLVHFHCYVANTGGSVHLDFSVDGTRHGGDDGITRVISNSGGAISFTRKIEGLAAGAHTFNLMWKVSGGTGNLYAGAATANFDIHPQFWVAEIS